MAFETELDKADQVLGTFYFGPEQRRGTRQGYITTATATWLRKDGQATDGGDAVIFITRDYSDGGLGFLHVEPIAVGDLLRLTFVRPDGVSKSGVLEVRHCRKIEPENYFVGGQFIK